MTGFRYLCQVGMRAVLLIENSCLKKVAKVWKAVVFNLAMGQWTLLGLNWFSAWSMSHGSWTMTTKLSPSIGHKLVPEKVHYSWYFCCALTALTWYGAKCIIIIDGRTDNMCENNDPYWPWLWVGLVDQKCTYKINWATTAWPKFGF